MQETRERNRYQTSLQNVKPEKLTDVNEALSVNASAAEQGSVNSVVVIDELDKIDSAIDIDAAEIGDLYFDYSRMIDIETLSFDINKLTKVRRRKKEAAAVKVRVHEEVRLERDIDYAEKKDTAAGREFEETKAEVLEAAVPVAVEGEPLLKETAAAEPLTRIADEAQKALDAGKEEQKKVIVIEIPEEFRNQISEIISIEDLGRVNLREAEEIANEDIFFLAGEELREELEELDIMPEREIKSFRNDIGSEVKTLDEKTAAAGKSAAAKDSTAAEDAAKVKSAEREIWKPAENASEPLKSERIEEVPFLEEPSPLEDKTADAETGVKKKVESGAVKFSPENVPERPASAAEKKTVKEIFPAEESDIEEILIIEDSQPAEEKSPAMESKIATGPVLKNEESGMEETTISERNVPEKIDFIKHEKKITGKPTVEKTAGVIDIPGIEKKEKSYKIIQPEEKIITKEKSAVRIDDESGIEEMTITPDDIKIEPAEEINIDELEIEGGFIKDEEAAGKKVPSAGNAGFSGDEHKIEKMSVSGLSMPYEERPVPEEVLYTDEESVDDILDEMELSVFEDETILLDDKLEAEELRDEDLINTDNVILTADNSVVEKVKAPESHTPARGRIDFYTVDAAAESVPIRDELDEFDELEFEEFDAAEDFEPIEDELISEEIAFDKDLPRAKESVHIKDELSGDYSESKPEGVTFKEEKIDLAEGEFEEKTYKIDESEIEGIKFEDRDNFSDEKELQNIDVTVLTDLADEDSAIGDMSFDDEDFNVFAEESKSIPEEKDVMTDKRDGKQKINLDALDIEPSVKNMENLTEFTGDNLEEIDILKIQDESSAAREEPADLTSDKFSEPDSPWDDLPVSTGDRRVFLIDDEPLIKPAVRSGIKTEEEKLSEIVSVIVDLVRGEAKQLDISTAEEETYLTIDAPVKFDDFHVETEEKISFIDDDIDFVDSVFLSDDESMGSGTAVSASEPEKKKVASAERQMDTDSEEMDLIEDSIFGREYTASDFDEDRDIVELEGAGGAAAGKKLRYILPRSDSLSDEERISIEEDIKSGSALILEEDVEEIKEKLDFIIKKKIEESIQDITEKIRIIEDEGDTKESIRKMVLDNRDDLTRLIKYMDGLLGKLPDGEIKSFADSEYYDLYLKVLKEMNK